MSSHLETVPCDLLQRIAFLCASSSVLESPVEILRLMQTSSTIYRSLNVRAAPHLYAQVFATKFDTSAPFRRYRSTLTDSARTAELSNRCRLLQRVQRADFSPVALMQDLWTAMWMLLESDGLNELQLSGANFTDFIIGLARIQLGGDPRADHRTDARALKQIIVWLLCLCLRRRVILHMCKQDRDELYSLIFPYIFLSNKKPELPASSGHECPVCSIALDGCTCFLRGKIDPKSSSANFRSYENANVSLYLRRQLPAVPDPSLAAINLASVILEANPLKIPPHLPETRAIANATQRTGPTKEDYRVLCSYETPLFADSMPNEIPEFSTPNGSPETLRSTLHDIEFGDMLQRPNSASCPYDVLPYIPGTMTGVWEGIYRTIPLPMTSSETGLQLHPLASMTIVKPLQCALTEYICEKAHSSAQDGSEFRLKGRKYRKIVPSTHAVPHPEATDVILLGETLENHDQAWGGFKFSGKVQRDGRVVLKREAKDVSGNLGLWLFEGRLRFGTTVLGRWRMTGASDSVDHGIFSLGKALENLKD